MWRRRQSIGLPVLTLSPPELFCIQIRRDFSLFCCVSHDHAVSFWRVKALGTAGVSTPLTQTHVSVSISVIVVALFSRAKFSV